MRKSFLLSTLLSSLLFSGEFEWGKGTIEVKGGFLGLTGTISDDIDTYALVENHKNIFNTNIFYGYDLVFFDSQTIKQLQNNYNSGASQANSLINSSGMGNNYIEVPTIEHRLKGVDAGVTLGYDILHKSESDYLGVGLYLGISAPYIKSKKSDSNAISNALASAYKTSKTEFTTYKVGVGIYAQKSLTDLISTYGSAIYAYQKASVKNSYAKSDFSVNGNYLELNAGLKFQPLKEDYDLGIITFSPRLYAKIGWRYREWNVDNIAINLSGIASIKTPKSDMKFSTNVAYIGLGYSF